MTEPQASTGESAATLSAGVQAFLDQPHIARIATASYATRKPHVVPVWYEWDGEAVWISSFRSTRKVKHLLKNPYVSIVVDIAAGNSNQGVIFEGRAELVEAPLEFVHTKATQVYARYLGEEGALEETPQSWIHDPEHLLIKLKPERTISWGM